MSTSRVEQINCRSALADRKLIPDDQVSIFCEILQFRYQYGETYDTEEGRTIYFNRIRPLLTKLKFPVGSNPGFAWKLILPKQSEYTYLCDLHKGLNADFVHQWFKFLALEVGARLEALRGSQPDFVGQNGWDNVVKPLTRLHKIWETREKVDEAFGDFVDTGFEGAKDLIGVERQRDGCEACMLARIASHAPTLLALRIAVKSRISLESSAKHPSRLRLLRLIEPWVNLWQAGIDQRSRHYDASLQQRRDSIRLANELYGKRERIKLYNHEMKHQAEQAREDARMKDVFHQAENDEIDSYTALRASQRHSMSLRSQASSQRVGGSSTGLTGERNPYEPIEDPAYRESRYSNDTLRDNRGVVEGSSGLAADLHAPNRSSETDSVQTRWSDVMAGGSGGINPYSSKASPLGRISEEPTERDVPGRQDSVRQPVRGGVPKLKSSTHRNESKRHVDPTKYHHPAVSSVYSQASQSSGHKSHTDVPILSKYDIPDSSSVYSQASYRDEHKRRGDPFKNDRVASSVYSQASQGDNYRSYADVPILPKHAVPDASSIYSQVSHPSTQDRRDGGSSVSSMNTNDEHYGQPEKPRRPQRESRESEWTNASMDVSSSSGEDTVKSRLSRPFDQPAYYGSGSDLSKQKRYR